MLKDQAFCCHPKNKDDFEGNCYVDICPLIRKETDAGKKAFGWFVYFLTVIAVVLFLGFFFSGCQSWEEFKTESGLECVVVDNVYSVSHSCNYDKYNVDTNFGEYPYAIKEKKENG